MTELSIYLAGNIEEFYIKDETKDITLKSYVSTTYQTLDDSIKKITDNLNFISSFDDGGSSIYKNQEKDITMIVCNTLDNNKDIFIGDYLMNFDYDFMCE